MALFFFGYCVVSGVVTPFFPLWLEARGLSEAEIANTLAIILVGWVVLTPLVGYLADQAPNRRFVVRILSVVAAIVFLFAWFANDFWTLQVTAGLGLVCWNLCLPVAEALALTGVRRFRLDYGRMRLGGSLSFIITNLGSGAAIGVLAAGSIFWMVQGALLMSLAVAFTLPVTPPVQRAIDDATRTPPAKARTVLARPGFLALLFVGGLIQSSHAVLYSFGSINWQRMGFSGVEIGSFWAVGIIFEITVFTFSGALVRTFGPFMLLVIGAIAAMLRWGLFAFDLGFVGFAALQALHCLTFGAAYLGNQHLIARTVPEEMTASAQAIFRMIQGVSLAATTAVAGPLFEAFGQQAFFAMVVPPAIAVAILAGHRGFTRRAAALA
jgi:PPP family 3-phenylpropionic acid transporter